MTGTATTASSPPTPPSSEAPAGPAVPPAKRRRTSRRVLVVFVLLAVALVFLLVEGVGSSLDYFDTVDQALAHKTSLGTQTFRLEGTVVPGSIRPTSTGTAFVICRGTQVRPRDQHREPAAALPAPDPRGGGGPLRLGGVDRVRVQHHHGQALRDLHRPVPEPGQGDVDGFRLLMVDAQLGTIGIWLAFVACLVGAAMTVAGLARRRWRAGDPPDAGDGRLFAPVLLVGALLATGAMEHALVTHDFALVFVAGNNSTVTPLLYSITGMWSALAGSILLVGPHPRRGQHRLRVALPAPGRPTR